MAKDSRTIIIGLDGMPFGLIEELTDTGVMSNTARLRENGTFKKMQSTIPEVSSVAWSSIITGVNPGEHGIFGFTDLRENSYRLRFPNFSTLKGEPFWDRWSGKSVIVNVPSTYPVREMNGVHISGFVSIELEQSVHPKSLIPQLESFDYRLDVDSQLAHSNTEAFLDDLDATLEARIKAAEFLWDDIDFSTFMFVFTGTDRLMHFLWAAYEDKNHKHHDRFLSHFARIDEAIGSMVSKMGDKDQLIMLSDHGFEKLDYDVNISHLLVENGFLKFKNNQEPSLENICPGTKALTLDPARIYVNAAGRYPCGSVEQADVVKTLGELESLFSSLEIDGRKVIRGIYRKEQLYSGPCFDIAPDMVLVGAEGFNLKATPKATQLTTKPIFTGKHTHDTAFLLVNDKSAKVLEPVSVIDAISIAERLARIDPAS